MSPGTPLPEDTYRHIMDLIAAKDSDGIVNSPKKVVAGMKKMIEDYELSEEARVKAFLKTYTDSQK